MSSSSIRTEQIWLKLSAAERSFAGALRGLMPPIFRLRLPVPRQQLVEPALRHVGDAGEDVGEPGLRIDVVELGGDDQRVHEGGALGAAVGAGEQPRLSAESKAAQRPFGGIVRQADAAVVEEAGEAVPALQHVVDRLGDRELARQLGPLAAHPGFELGDERRASLLASRQALRRRPDR